MVISDFINYSDLNVLRNNLVDIKSALEEAISKEHALLFDELLTMFINYKNTISHEDNILEVIANKTILYDCYRQISDKIDSITLKNFYTSSDVYCTHITEDIINNIEKNPLSVTGIVINNLLLDSLVKVLNYPSIGVLSKDNGINMSILNNISRNEILSLYSIEEIVFTLRNYRELIQRTISILEGKLSTTTEIDFVLKSRIKHLLDSISQVYYKNATLQNDYKNQDLSKKYFLVNKLLNYLDFLLKSNNTITEDVQKAIDYMSNEIVCVFKVNSITEMNDKNMNKVYKVKGINSYINIVPVNELLYSESYTSDIMSISKAGNVRMLSLYFVFLKMFRSVNMQNMIITELTRAGYISGINLNSDFVQNTLAYYNIVDDLDNAQSMLTILTIIFRMVYISVFERNNMLAENSQKMLGSKLIEIIDSIAEHIGSSSKMQNRHAIIENAVINHILSEELESYRNRYDKVKPDIRQYMNLLSIVKEPLFWYDINTKCIFYIPIGDFMNYNVDDIYSNTDTLSEFCFSNVNKDTLDMDIINDTNDNIVMIEYDNNGSTEYKKIVMYCDCNYKFMATRDDSSNVEFFTIYANKVCYPKIYTTILNAQGDTVTLSTSDSMSNELIDYVYVSYSNDELKDIVNDFVGFYNMSMGTRNAINCENKLLNSGTKNIDYINDVTFDKGLMFYRGDIGMNRYYMCVELKGMYRICDITPHSVINVPFGNNNGNVSFNIGKHKYNLKLHTSLFTPGTNYLNSRKILMNILMKYSEGGFSSPFTFNYIFMKNKKEILKEYFSNLSILIKTIINGELYELIENINTESALKDNSLNRIIRSMLISDQKMVVKSENNMFNILNGTLEELLNVVILIQKNKKMQLAYDTSYVEGELVLSRKSFDVNVIDDITIDKLDFTEVNLNYDLITLEDLWGYNFSKVYTNIKNKEVKPLFYTNKKNDYISLVIKNFDLTKSAQVKLKDMVTIAIRLIYGIFEIKDTLIADKYINKIDTFSSSTIFNKKIEEDNNIMKKYFVNKFNNLNEDMVVGGFKDWLNEFEQEFIKLGLDKDWITQYSRYIGKLFDRLPVPEVASFNKTKNKINKSLFIGLYIKYMLEMDECNTEVNNKNKLFFNSLKGNTSLNKNLEIINILSEHCFNSNVNLVDLLFYITGIKEPQTSWLLSNTVLFEDIVSNYKGKHSKLKELPEDKLLLLNNFLTRIVLSKDITSNKCIEVGIDYLLQLKQNDILKIDEKVLDNQLYRLGFPSKYSFKSIDKYMDNIEDIELENFSIESYKSYDNGDCNVTLERDYTLLLNVFNDGAFIRTITWYKGESSLNKVINAFKNALFNNTIDYSYSCTDEWFKNTYLYQTMLIIGKTISEDKVLKFTKNFYKKVSSVVTHSTELYLVSEDLVNKFRNINDKIILSNKDNIICNLKDDISISLSELRQLEDNISECIRAKEFYSVLYPYCSLHEYNKIIDGYNSLNEVISKKYDLYRLREESIKTEKAKSELIYKNFLSNQSDELYKYIDFDLLSFDTLVNNNWYTNLLPSVYSLRAIARNDKYCKIRIDDVINIYGDYIGIDLDSNIIDIDIDINSGKYRSIKINYNYSKLLDVAVTKQNIPIDEKYFDVNNPSLISVSINAIDLCEILYLYSIKLNNSLNDFNERFNQISKNAINNWITNLYNTCKENNTLDDYFTNGDVNKPSYKLGEKMNKAIERIDFDTKVYLCIDELCKVIDRYYQNANRTALSELKALIICYCIDNNLLISDTGRIMTTIGDSFINVYQFIVCYNKFMNSNYTDIMRMIEEYVSRLHDDDIKLTDLLSYIRDKGQFMTNNYQTYVKLNRLEYELNNQGKTLTEDVLDQIDYSGILSSLRQLPRSIRIEISNDTLNIHNIERKHFENSRLYEADGSPLLMYRVKYID